MKFCIYRLLPTRLLSRCFGAIMGCKVGFIKNLLINVYCSLYKIDLSECEYTIATDYPSLDAFFTRKLRAGVRALDVAKTDVICPVDGRIMELGIIQGKTCLQVKGITYQLADLLGDDDFLAQHYADGLYANLYLAPDNYHRIHMPVDAELQHMTYIPGPLLPVKPSIINNIPGVLSGNERLVCEFSTARGSMLIVLVGAFFVGSIEVAWHPGELVNPKHSRHLKNWNYSAERITLKQGDELGCFHMGSSVVLIFNDSSMSWCSDLVSQKQVRYGDPIASVRDRG